MTVFEQLTEGTHPPPENQLTMHVTELRIGDFELMFFPLFSFSFEGVTKEYFEISIRNMISDCGRHFSFNPTSSRNLLQSLSKLSPDPVKRYALALKLGLLETLADW